MGTIPDFQFVEINCLRISQPVEAYTVLWRALSGEFSSAKVALKQLTEFFAKQDEHHFSNSKTKTESRSIACLLDELDFLITADEQVPSCRLHAHTSPLHPTSSPIIFCLTSHLISYRLLPYIPPHLLSSSTIPMIVTASTLIFSVKL